MRSFSSDHFFCESKHVVTYQKISVLDRKQLKLNTVKTLEFSVVAVLSPFSRAWQLSQPFTRKHAIIFVDSCFQVPMKLDVFEISLLKTQVHVLNC